MKQITIPEIIKLLGSNDFADVVLNGLPTRVFTENGLKHFLSSHLDTDEWQRRESMIIAAANGGAMQNLTMWKAEVVEKIEAMKKVTWIDGLADIGQNDLLRKNGYNEALDQVINLINQLKEC
jgi:hypothetical protein